jgi:hypothetical protein
MARRGENVYRPEPMDINTTYVEGRKRRSRWTQQRTASSSGESTAEDSSRSRGVSSGSESEGPAVKAPKAKKSYAEVSRGKITQE